MSSNSISSSDGSEHYWPNIKNAILMNPTGQPPDQRMKPQCPICFEKFNITTFDKPSRDAPTCEVLFCGHVLCRGCLIESEESGVGGREKKCPCCREELACRCGEASKTFTVPGANTSPDAVFDAPLTKPEDPNIDENTKPMCHRCTASGEWLGRIDNGDWPREAETIEPGAVRFFYGAIDELESEGRSVSPDSVSSAFNSVTSDEYQMLTGHRNDFISQRSSELESTNSWFGRLRETVGLGPSSSSNDHHIHRCQLVIDYQAPLDPPLDAAAHARRREFEERRRIHDRLPEERNLQDQLSGQNLGGESHFNAFGRPRRSDRGERAVRRFDNVRYGGPRRVHTGTGDMTNHGDFGAGHETGRDALSSAQYRAQYGWDTGNQYSSQGGGETDDQYYSLQRRQTDNPYSSQRGWGTENPYSSQRGGETDDQYYSLQRRETDNPYSSQRGSETNDSYYGLQRRQTDNPYSSQHGRDTGNGAPQSWNIGYSYGGAPYGGDTGRDRHLSNTQRDAVIEAEFLAQQPRNRTNRGGDRPSGRRW